MSPTAGTLNFAAGVNTQTISVTINGDTKVESDETFFVNLSGATNGATISDNLGIGTILNDDARPASVAIDDVTVTEGDNGTKVATFTVTRSGGTAAFAVNFATSDGSATIADSDYVAAAGTLNFGAGVNTQTISVTHQRRHQGRARRDLLRHAVGSDQRRYHQRRPRASAPSPTMIVGTISDQDFNGDGKTDLFFRQRHHAMASRSGR